MNLIYVLKNCLNKCKSKGYKGYDPYDALNSPILNSKARFFNILSTQLIKKAPINIRSFFKIDEERNPLGIALFSLTYENMSKLSKKYKLESKKLLEWLINNKKRDNDHIYWGYNFPWQSRRSFLPKNGPCSVVTYFVGRVIEKVSDEDEEILNSIGKFYTEGLNRLIDNEDHLCLSYTPYERVKIVNSNALIASQLLKFGKKIDNKKFIEDSKRMINWVISEQEKNGGWYYSPDSHLGMDNFHNGYVLWALMDYLDASDDSQLNKRLIGSIQNGLGFYRRLFDEDGQPYFSIEKKYPVDIHDCSQGIITFKIAEEHDLHGEEFYETIFDYTIENMWDNDKNYFYYQKHRLWTNKINYMRWSQAWMCYAMSLML